MKVFHHIWAWRLSSSYDPDTNKPLSTRPMDARHAVQIYWPSCFASSLRVTEENVVHVFETVQSGPYSSFECFLCS